MTDNEIIKALECCMNGRCGDCPDRKAREHCYDLESLILDLINRQNAEIERLEHKQNKEYAIISNVISQAKTEAIKEFATRFENEFDKIEEFYFEEEHENFVSANKVLAFLDNLVKEMVDEG